MGLHCLSIPSKVMQIYITTLPMYTATWIGTKLGKDIALSVTKTSPHILQAGLQIRFES